MAVKFLDSCFLTTFVKKKKKKKQVLRDSFGKIWRIQSKMYPQTSIELRYGAFN